MTVSLPPLRQAYLGLGSNLNDPVSQIKGAVKALQSHQYIIVKARSSLYLTSPVGFLDQPDFINAVVEIYTSLTPEDLLSSVLDIEKQLGRERTFRNAPRILDIDILWYEGLFIKTDQLTLPHPRLFERPFMLVPLAELNPHLNIMPHGKVNELMASLNCDTVKRLDIPI